MLIYSQNKDIIANLDNITSIYIGNIFNSTTIYYESNSDEITKLGIYSSIERCKEILEDIIDFYQDISVSNSVYYMPEK